MHNRRVRYAQYPNPLLFVETSPNFVPNAMDAAPSPVILVAAGSAGFGAQVASTFAQQGYRVVINYNSNSERAEKLLAQISGQEGDNPSTSTTAITFRYIALCADLSAQFEIQRLVHGTYKIMGRIDVVLSNGGWSRFRDTSSIDDNVCEEDWDRAFAASGGGGGVFYLIGWIIFMGETATAASCTMNSVQVIVGMVQITYPDWEAPRAYDVRTDILFVPETPSRFKGLNSNSDFLMIPLVEPHIHYTLGRDN
ncbi:uncharacterized protein KD926_011311 [Aspergillus affinis]|uniref:uncharacterized protein n=1 Tax=Aspergillus affinis TaxID=1070780 RepID=UPI0022FE0345|nr:uncharacterized protein KD926_011311 [Aspergillus affinis]KAI9038073.1 hypothetical protein KD926_011311 [Aspergillus affinis]